MPTAGKPSGSNENYLPEVVASYMLVVWVLALYCAQSSSVIERKVPIPVEDNAIRRDYRSVRHGVFGWCDDDKCGVNEDLSDICEDFPIAGVQALCTIALVVHMIAIICSGFWRQGALKGGGLVVGLLVLAAGLLYITSAVYLSVQARACLGQADTYERRLSFEYYLACVIPMLLWLPAIAFTNDIQVQHPFRRRMSKE